MKRIYFRLANRGDEKKAVNLFRLLMGGGEDYFTDTYPYNESEYGKFIDEGITEHITFFAITEDEEIIAWISLLKKPFKFQKHIGSLILGVRQEYRHLGIGRSLLIDIEKNARRIGVEKIEAQVRRHSVAAMGFFKSQKYTVEGVREKSIKVASVYEDEIIFSKFIE